MYYTSPLESFVSFIIIILLACLLTLFSLSMTYRLIIKVSHDLGYYVSIPSLSDLQFICPDLVLILHFMESWLLLVFMFLDLSFLETQPGLLSDILVLESIPWLCGVGISWVLSSHL